MTGGPGGGTGPETPAGQGGLTGAGGGTGQDSPAGQHGAASTRLRAFGAFWYDFLVGDDWLLAVAVLAGLLATWLLHRAGVAAWWLLPVVVIVALAVSIRRAIRPHPPSR